MQPQLARTAFTLTALHQRRDGRRITAIGLYQDGTRVLLGFDNGHLEEHALLRGTVAAAPAASAAGVPFAAHAALRLLAERRVFRQAMVAIAPLAGAERAALLGADGSVVLCAAESLELAQLPQARSAVAIAASGGRGAVAGQGADVPPAVRVPARLAVAVKAGKGKAKVLLYDVLPLGSTSSMGGNPALLAMQVPLPETVLQMAWVGRSLLLAVPNGYKVLHGSTVVQIADQVPCAPLLGSLPGQGLGLLLWDDTMALVTDAKGAAVREPLLLPSRPLAFAQAGLFIVAVCDDGVHVFDRGSSKEVQVMDWAHDDAYVNLSRALPAADDASGRCVVMATSSVVLLLEPIALEQQVRELLKRKAFDQALDLLDLCRAAPDNASWVGTATAQAALLLLLDAEFGRGCEVLGRLPLATFQPCELFALFPSYTARWLPQVARKSYWGLHGSLPDLDTLVADHLELQAATRQHRGQHQHGRSRSQPQQQQQQQQQGLQQDQQQYVLHLQTHRHQQQQLEGKQHGSSPGGDTAAGPSAAAELAQAAKHCIVDYLLQARQKPGLELADGVDTLLVQLLCDCQEAARLETLVAAPHAASPREAAAAMSAVGRWHGLALMWSALGQPREALDIWQGLSQGTLEEAPSSNGEVAAAAAATVAAAAAAAAAAASSSAATTSSHHHPSSATGSQTQQDPFRAAAASVAVRSAAKELGRADRVPVQLAMQYLPWLLQQDGAAALQLLTARELPAQQVLVLLRGRSDDLRWQYLQHLVHERGSSDAALHTELALELAAAAIAAAAGMAAAAWEAVGGSLPVLFASNSGAEGTGISASGRTHSVASMLLHTPGHSRHASMSGAGPGSNYPAAPGRRHSVMSSGGALAGGPLQLRRAAAGLGGSHSHAPSRTLSGIAAILQQQQQLQGQGQQLLGPSRTVSFVPAAGAGTGSSDGSPALRSLPALWPALVEALGGNGPTSIAAPGAANGVAAPAGTVTAASCTLPSTSNAAAASGSSATAAAAPSATEQAGTAEALAAAADGGAVDGKVQSQHRRVLLLRCTLAYHLQASLLYDAHTVLQTLRNARANAGASSTSSTCNTGGARDIVVTGTTGSTAATAATEGGAVVSSASGGQQISRGAEPLSSDVRIPQPPQQQLAELQSEHQQQCLQLLPEQALVLSRLGEHAGALRLWALHSGQVEGAITYARALGSQEAWLALLEMFLKPGKGLSPNYTAACRVLNAEGAALNPLKLLQSLSDDMPLALAHDTLARMMAGILHRRRAGQVIRALNRSLNLAARAERGELQSARVVVTDESTCRGCQRLMGTKIFFRYPSGVVLCSRCAGAGAAAQQQLLGGSENPFVDS